MTEQLQQATRVARSLGMVPTWPNLRTIEIALICETAFSSSTLKRASDVLVSCARAFRATEPHLLRYFPINRFWFEDAVWRQTFEYACWQAGENPDELRQKEAEKKRRLDEEIRAAIVGRCTGCNRPRFAGNNWTDFCCAGCREDYQGRVELRDRLKKQAPQEAA